MVKGIIVDVKGSRNPEERESALTKFSIYCNGKTVAGRWKPFKVKLSSTVVNRWECSEIEAKLAKIPSRDEIFEPSVSKRSDGDYFFYLFNVAHLSKRQREKLPRQFQHDVEIGDLLRWQSQVPFGIVDVDEISGEIIFPIQKKYASIDELLQGRIAATDIETKNWQKRKLNESMLQMSDVELLDFYKKLCSENLTHFESHSENRQRRDLLKRIEIEIDRTRKEEITIVAYIGEAEHKYLVTTFDIGKEEIFVEHPLTKEQISVKIIRAETQKELGAKLSLLFKKHDPLYVATHNGMTFDYDKLMRITKRFEPGTDGTKPEHVHTLKPVKDEDKIFSHYRIFGRIDIDPRLFYLHYGWLVRNKLDYVFRDLTGIDAPKDVSHLEGVLLTIQAEKGDKDAAERLLRYCATDTLKSQVISEKLIERILHISRNYGVSPSFAQYSSHKTNAIHRYDRENLARGHAVKSHGLLRAKRKPEAVDTQWQEFSVASLWQKQIVSRVAVARGRKENVVLTYLTPFRDFWGKTNYINRTCKVNPSARDAIEYVDREKGSAAIHVAECLDSIVEARIFLEHNSGNHCTIRGKICEFDEKLSGLNFVNYSDLFAVVEDDEQIYELERQGALIILGKGRMLSRGLKKFVAHVDGKIVPQGVDVLGKMGGKSPFEQEVIERFFEIALVQDDLRGALTYVSEMGGRVYREELAPEENSYKGVARKNFWEYSARATGQRIQRAREIEARKGDEIIVERSYADMFDVERKPGSVTKAVYFAVKKTPNNDELLEELFKGDISIVKHLTNKSEQLSLF